MRLGRQLFRPGRSVERVNAFLLRLRSTRDAGGDARRVAGSRFRALIPPLAEHLGGAFSVILSVVLIGALVALLFAFVKELRSDTLVLEGFTAPPDLVAQGYTPTVIAERVLDEIRSIYQAARTTHPHRSLESSAQVADIDIAHGALSMRAVVRYTRRMLGLPDRSIGGEIVRQDRKLRATVRVNDKGGVQLRTSERADGNAEALLKDVARDIVQTVDSYVFASFLFEEELKEPNLPFRRTLAAIDYVLTHPPEEDHALGMKLLGSVQMAQGRFDDAAQSFREARRMAPNLPYIVDYLAYALYFSGHVEEASKLQPAATPDPSWSADRLAARAASFVAQNRFAEAEAFARAALAVAPENENAQGSLIEALKQLHRPTEALAEVEKTMAPISKSGPHEGQYIELLILTGRPREALTIAEARNAAKPDDAYLTYALGLAFAATGRYADAASAYERANLSINGFSPLLIAWGDALLGLHESESALAKMRAAAALDPTFGATHAGEGRALLALGKPTEAAASYARACELDTHDPAALRVWAQVLDTLGRKSEAAEKRDRANIVERENSQPRTAAK